MPAFARAIPTGMALAVSVRFLPADHCLILLFILFVKDVPAKKPEKSASLRPSPV